MVTWRIFAYSIGKKILEVWEALQAQSINENYSRVTMNMNF